MTHKLQKFAVVGSMALCSSFVQPISLGRRFSQLQLSFTAVSCRDCRTMSASAPLWSPNWGRSLLALVSALVVELGFMQAHNTGLANALAVYSVVDPATKAASDQFNRRVSLAVDLLEKGRDAQARGDYDASAQFFGEVIEEAGDLALSEYARVGHALALYEIGDRGDAITEMEDVSISLKGYPEVHAALAAALYVDKHATIAAEQQFTIATLLDPQYVDSNYVKESKHWPPSLIASLEKFKALK